MLTNFVAAKIVFYVFLRFANKFFLNRGAVGEASGDADQIIMYFMVCLFELLLRIYAYVTHHFLCSTIIINFCGKCKFVREVVAHKFRGCKNGFLRFS